MEIGILNKYDEKIIEKAQKENKAIALGIEPASLLDQLNILEVQTQYNTSAILAAIKAEILQILGKIEIQQEEEDKNVQQSATK